MQHVTIHSIPKQSLTPDYMKEKTITLPFLCAGLTPACTL